MKQNSQCRVRIQDQERDALHDPSVIGITESDLVGSLITQDFHENQPRRAFSMLRSSARWMSDLLGTKRLPFRNPIYHPPASEHTNFSASHQAGIFTFSQDIPGQKEEWIRPA